VTGHKDVLTCLKVLMPDGGWLVETGCAGAFLVFLFAFWSKVLTCRCDLLQRSRNLLVFLEKIQLIFPKLLESRSDAEKYEKQHLSCCKGLFLAKKQPEKRKKGGKSGQKLFGTPAHIGSNIHLLGCFSSHLCNVNFI